jgi:hypothetical protein
MKNYEVHEELIENFEKHSSELYQLAFLLTGNTDRSVQAFTLALELDEQMNSVFDGFMNEWARKLIMVEALGTIKTELRRSIARVARMGGEEALGSGRWTQRQGIAKEEFEEAVIAIDAFPRCAMLLTIFEGLPLKTAAILLDAGEALTAAAQRIGILQLTRRLTGNSGRDPYEGMNPVPMLSLS